MTVTKTKAPVEQLTIYVDDTPTGGTLRVEWGGERARAVHGRLAPSAFAPAVRRSPPVQW